MATQLIGLLGRQRSGKDTFAARLVEKHGYTRFFFADALRECALQLDPYIVVTSDEYGVLEGWCLPYDRPYVTRLSHLVGALGWDRAKALREVRRVMQHTGTGVRHLDPDFWLRITMDAIDNHPGPAVITDVRFPNELDAVRRRLGYSVRITRPGLPNDDLHISETALDDARVDRVIDNSRTVASLHDYADATARFVRALSA